MGDRGQASLEALASMASPDRGQASLEALVSMAALLAFMLIMARASSELAARSGAFSLALGDRVRAQALALELDMDSADGRLSAYNGVDLGGCALVGDGVACGNASVRTVMGNDAHGLNRFYESLPA